MTTTLTHQLNEAQLAAAKEILERISDREAIVTLAGLAGTGKTFLTRSILRQLCERDWRILLTAPTHQALAVARADLPDEIETMTVHAALGLTVRENEDGTTHITSRARSKIRGFDLVVVDEASMVGQELYQTLMRERQCAVLFVGDPGQLPPIGERESPAFAEVSNRIALTEVVRQAEGSPLITLAHAIRTEAENGRRVNIETIRPLATGAAQVQQGSIFTVTSLVTDARTSGFDAVGLTYRNEDVDRINAGVHRALFPDSTQAFAQGERILFRAPYHEEGREDEEPLARTNDLATILEMSDPFAGPFETPTINLTIEFMDGRIRTVPVPVNSRSWRSAWGNLFAAHRAAKAQARLTTDVHEIDRLKETARTASAKAWMLRTRFANVQHTYAMTAHRAQGSTFEVVVLDWRGLARMSDDFEHARAVYVSATRPSQYLVIVE